MAQQIKQFTDGIPWNQQTKILLFSIDLMNVCQYYVGISLLWWQGNTKKLTLRDRQNPLLANKKCELLSHGHRSRAATRRRRLIPCFDSTQEATDLHPLCHVFHPTPVLSLSITRRYSSLARLFLECLTSRYSIHRQGERRKSPAIGGEANGWGRKRLDDFFIYIYESHLDLLLVLYT